MHTVRCVLMYGRSTGNLQGFREVAENRLSFFRASATRLKAGVSGAEDSDDVRLRPRRRQASADGPWNQNDVHWAAIVVENIRVDVSQRNIAYLGGITESGIRIVHQRYDFWQKIDDTLKRLGNRIDKRDRHCIEEALASNRPSKAEAERVRRDARKMNSRSNPGHESKPDPGAKLARKGPAKIRQVELYVNLLARTGMDRLCDSRGFR
jgi:hypothetical protein